MDSDIVYILQNKVHLFLKALFASQDIEGILIHFLNDAWHKSIPLDEPNYILASYFARSNRGKLPLHIDSYIPFQRKHLIAMQYIVLLEDADRNNGCTVVVPGSHRSGEYCDQSAMDRSVPVEAS